ncbi:MAG: methyltransferase domain-containing protein [Candidatus Aminicenantes bacterium]|nr:methyltransferase domain-containing protein [Candidatus Aminicenantes bacterium]
MAEISPLLSKYAQKKKIKYFLKDIPKPAKILEVGCGSFWLGNYLKKSGWKNYVGLDLRPPADIVGNILNWKKLGIKGNSFDVIIAFEVIEHINCFQEFFDILKPGGLLMLTSPVPNMDWLCKLLETLRLNQKRTSPHDHLIYFKDIPFFEPIETKTVGFISQWGKFRKPIIKTAKRG